MRKINQKLPSFKTLRQKLTQGSELRQRKALWDILKFFIFMLLCTLVAKSVAGASMAVVETTAPMQATITQDISVSGIVTADDPTTLELPAGIHIVKALVRPGDKVSEDTPVLELDMDDLKQALQKQKILCSQTRLDITALRTDTVSDTGNLGSARNTLDWASQDYQATLQRLNEAMALTQQAQQRVQELEAQPSPDAGQLTAARQQLAEATAAQEQARAAAESAERAKQSAQASYTSMENAAKAALQQAETQKQKNALSAQLMEMELAGQIAVREQLSQLVSQQGVVTAGAKGVVLSVQEQGTLTGTDSALQLSMTGAACSLEAEIDSWRGDALAANAKVTFSNRKKSYDATLAAKYPGSAANTVKLRFRFSEKSDPVPGEQMYGNLIISQQNYSVCVPLTALHQDQNGFYVLVVEEKNTVLGLQNELVRVSVTIEAQDDMVAAISGALQFDSKIVSTSTRPVKAGDRVRLV